MGNKNYSKTKLKEIANINPPEKIAKGTMAKYVPMNNISEFNKKISNIEQREYKGGMKFRNGDILFARITPCLENGKTAFVDFLDDEEIGFGSTEYIVLREKENISDKHYLYYLSITPEFRKRAIKLMTGTSGRQRVQINAFKNLQISLPPLPEQKRIANILSSFDNKIELLREQNKTLENIAQTIFKQWFIDFNFPDSNGKPYKDSGGKMIESELGMIPEGWEFGKLETLGEIVCGKTPPKKNTKYFNGKIPFVKIPDMNNVFVTQTEDSLTDEGLQQVKNKLLPEGAICVSCIATVGEVSITIKSSVTNQQINSIIPTNFYLEFLYFYMIHLEEYLKQIANRGSTTLNINTGMFKDIEIVVPPVGLVKEFHNISSVYFNKIRENFLSIGNLAKIKDILLKKLIK